MRTIKAFMIGASVGIAAMAVMAAFVTMVHASIFLWHHFGLSQFQSRLLTLVILVALVGGAGGVIFKRLEDDT